ncbi:MAG: hypothetical protein ACE5KG_04980 [Nitrososphaerales archaeon]
MGIADSKIAKQIIWHTANITVIFLPVLLLAIFFGTARPGTNDLRQGLILVFVVFMGIDWFWFSQIRWRLKAKLGDKKEETDGRRA